MKGRIFIIILFSSLLFNRCDQVNPPEEVPAYINIDSIKLKTKPVDEGSNSHNITDAWVIINNEVVGTFELPETFPVLEKKQPKIVIRSGIKDNGISNTRAPYPFYKTLNIDSLNLEAKKVDSLNILTTEYVDQTQFAWIEDFEDTTDLVLENTSNSTVPFEITSNENEVFEGEYSLKATIRQRGGLFEVKARDPYIKEFDEPGKVYLEANFKTDIEIGTGIFAYRNSSSEQYTKAFMNKSPNEWKKIYINLTKKINEYPDSYSFSFFLGALKKTANPPATLYLDNLKLVYFE